ncbi:MAG: long-chain fatty acid--CoA ligase [Acidimicrobiia bacterium]|nr:long-chain fatty acid--CoA ligase [Acidimicrobiia bacterium]
MSTGKAWTTSNELTAVVAGHTVATRFRDTARAHPDRVALRCKSGDGWAEWTWADYADQACRLATALSGLGVVQGERVVLMMRNRPEFHIADIAVMLLGATPVSIYNSSAPEQVEYLARHCGAVVAIVEDIDYLERVLKVRGQLPALQAIAIIDDDGRAPGDVLHWADLLKNDPIDLDTAAGTANADDLATIIYTSGTTGPPKGVMLDHANIVWTVESLLRCWDEVPYFSRMVSYLPMAHIAERMTSHYQGIVGVFEVTTCPEPSRVASYLPDVRPEIMFAVPRVWEKIHAGVLALAGADPNQQAMLDAALPVGERVSEYRARDEALPPDLAAAWETAKPVGDFVLNLLGLDQIKSAISGAAPLPVEVLKFFRALGMEMSEIYGLSETSGPTTWEPFRVKVGSVGPRISGCEVVLAADGEVLSRGGNIFRGYLNDPERTAEALDDDGWLHSGDIGVLDDDGYLKIVDRKKELIITAGGKNISPANLEAALKSFPLIGQAAVIGDGRPCITALVVLDPEVAPAWAAKAGLASTALADLARDPVVLEEVARNVADANKRFSNVEQIKQFTVLGEEWLSDSEEMTPTMKLKRRGINSKFADEIEAMYSR